MAVVNFTTEYAINHHGAILPGVMIVTWANLLNLDTGQPYVCPDKSEKTVQASGAPGVGGSCSVQGSDGQAYVSSASGGTLAAAPSYAILNDPQGNPITFAAADITANKIETILENTTVVRPNVTAGDGATLVTIRMTVRTGKLVS